MRRLLSILPSVRIYEQMPGGIDGRALPSARANYRPCERTIYLSHKATLKDVLHEFGHHIIHVLGGNYEKQCKYDAVSSGIPVEWLIDHGYAVVPREEVKR